MQNAETSNVQHRTLNGWTRVTATRTRGMQKAAGEKQKLGKQKAERGAENIQHPTSNIEHPTSNGLERARRSGGDRRLPEAILTQGMQKVECRMQKFGSKPPSSHPEAIW